MPSNIAATKANAHLVVSHVACPMTPAVVDTLARHAVMLP